MHLSIKSDGFIMDIKKYIDSGILELYVAGVLSEKENQEVYDNMQRYPLIRTEVLQIELAVKSLSAAMAADYIVKPFKDLENRLTNRGKIIQLDQKAKSRPWLAYAGWAASVALLLGSVYMYNQNLNLKEALKIADIENAALEESIAKANESSEMANELVNIIRAKDIEAITLGGQAISPDAFAKVFWNKETKMAYIDVAGLPEPPAGKVYQVWSLKLNPLTPTSLGILDDYATDDNKVFTLSNENESQAFGITLEPAGGSESPTLEQLYALGVVKSS